jgi:hypothetical protein
MKVRELRTALAELEVLFEIGGTSAVRADLAGLQDMLEGAEDMELDDFLARLKSEIEFTPKQQGRKTVDIPANEEIVAHYIGRLEEAREDESLFLQILAELDSDGRVKKPELSRIAGKFGDSNAKTMSKLLQSIKTRFYEQLYIRDTTAMAKRATPW